MIGNDEPGSHREKPRNIVPARHLHDFTDGGPFADAPDAAVIKPGENKAHQKGDEHQPRQFGGGDGGHMSGSRTKIKHENSYKQENRAYLKEKCRLLATKNGQLLNKRHLL